MSQKAVIICVDDNHVVLTSLRSQLRREFGNFYEIETAESGEEAKEIFIDLQSENVDVPLVISDQIMPGMKGDELLEFIYKNSNNTLSIMLTGQADAKAVGNAVNNANLYRYITKPWDEVDLNMTVKEAIRSFYQDQKIEQQNKELAKLVEELRKYNESLEELVIERTQEIQIQKDIIQAKNQDITDSIMYAQKIQFAILTPEEQLKRLFPEYFILYLPKDIVSGDFYWLSEKDNKIFLTAADCTGHGVPGAFMSMLGVTLLNEIIDKPFIKTAADILNELRLNIIRQLHQRPNNQSRDGMDMSLCIIDKQLKNLNFAGAYNSLFLISDNQLIEYKANRMPVALHFDNTSFTDVDIKYKTGDKIYILSDGYADQFGGEKNRKFMMPNFKKILIEISPLPMLEQRKILFDAHIQWKGDNSQVDDIIVFGIELD